MLTDASLATHAGGKNVTYNVVATSAGTPGEAGYGLIGITNLSLRPDKPNPLIAVMKVMCAIGVVTARPLAVAGAYLRVMRRRRLRACTRFLPPCVFKATLKVVTTSIIKAALFPGLWPGGGAAFAVGEVGLSCQ